MGEVERWLEAVALLREGLAAHAAGDTAKFIDLFEQHCNVLESIAGDPKVAKDDRAKAAAILEDIGVQCRAATPNALRALAQIARDPNADAHDRDEATRTLARAAERLPPASDKLH